MGTENDFFNNLTYKESTSSGGWILCFCDNDYHHPLSATKAPGSQAAFRPVQSLLFLLVIAPVNRVVLESAAASKILLILRMLFCMKNAWPCREKYIVTINPGDFTSSTLPVFEQRLFVNALELLVNKSLWPGGCLNVVLIA
jgi:hypothetical protein